MKKKCSYHYRCPIPNSEYLYPLAIKFTGLQPFTFQKKV